MRGCAWRREVAPLARRPGLGTRRAHQLGITGVPTLILDGLTVVGTRPNEMLGWRWRNLASGLARGRGTSSPCNKDVTSGQNTMNRIRATLAVFAGTILQSLAACGAPWPC